MQKTPPEFTVSGNRLGMLGDREKSVGEYSIPREAIEKFSKDWISEAEYLLQSPRTIEGKSDAIKRLLWWMQTFEHSECGAREFRYFLAYVGNGHLRPEGRWGNPQMRRPVKPRTIQYYFNYLRSFCRWLHAEELIDDNPMRNMPVPRVEKHQIQPFSSEHMEALLLAARRSLHPRRDEAILLFMLDTGVRASELCGLRVCDVELHGSYGQARVLGKGRKIRTVPFSRRAAWALWTYLRETPRKNDAPIFLSDRGITKGAPLTRSGLLQLFERLGAAAHLQNVRCSPHTMRHTFAISFLRAGGNTFTLQQMMGHTALHQTQRYVSIAQADIENQHRQFSPADRLSKSLI